MAEKFSMTKNSGGGPQYNSQKCQQNFNDKTATTTAQIDPKPQKILEKKQLKKMAESSGSQQEPSVGVESKATDYPEIKAETGNSGAGAFQLVQESLHHLTPDQLRVVALDIAAKLRGQELSMQEEAAAPDADVTTALVIEDENLNTISGGDLFKK